MRIIISLQLLIFLSHLLSEGSALGRNTGQSNSSNPEKSEKVLYGRSKQKKKTNFFNEKTWEKNYIGCFTDSRRRRDFPMERISDRRTLTIPKCMKHCWEKKAGYKFCAVQAGFQCACNRNEWTGPRSTYGRHVRDSECRSACSGAPGYDCGGPWRNSVYKVPDFEAQIDRYEVKNIVFTEDKTHAEVADKPNMMSYTTIVNESDEEVEVTRALSSTYATTISNEVSHSMSVGVSLTSTWSFGTEEAGSSWELGIDTSYSFTHTKGKEHTTEHSISREVTIKVPSRMQCVVTLMAKRKEVDLRYTGTLITHYKNYPKSEDDVEGRIDSVTFSNFEVEYEQCTEICPPSLGDDGDGCDETTACVKDSDCESGENCKCSKECGMVCKEKKPAHPCTNDPPICERDGKCIRVDPEDEKDSRYESLKDQLERERLFRDQNVIIDIERVSPLEKDKEFKCECVKPFEGKYCELMPGEAVYEGIKCKHGWDIYAGVFGREAWKREDVCAPDEMCIRLEGYLDTPGPIHHYHKIYRCYAKHRCQELLDQEGHCMNVALSTTNSGHNFMVQAMNCKGVCCSEDNCNNKPLAVLRPELFPPLPVYVPTTTPPPNTQDTCRNRGKRDDDGEEKGDAIIGEEHQEE